MARLGTLLVVAGLVASGFGVLWQLGLVPGSRVTLPPPVALERPTLTPPSVVIPTPREVLAPTPPAPTPTPVPLATPLRAADADERAFPAPAPTVVSTASVPESGYAVRLAIPSIKLDTPVEQGGIVEDASGQLVWETLPFVAVHYGDLTSLVGAPGNAVIAGHVVTLNEGNVFRFLYQLDLDDQIEVWDNKGLEHDFKVVSVRLVPPSDTSVMAPTPDPTLTLITCGGTFDPIRREFSDRLIVIAKPS